MTFATNPLDGLRVYFEDRGGDGAPILLHGDLADRLSERIRLAEFSVNQVLVKDLRPVPAVCVIGRP